MDNLIRDELNLDYLSSCEDANRLLGAMRLENIGIEYFQEGTLGFSDRIVDTDLIRLKQEELINSYEKTEHSVVKKWALFFFMEAFIRNERINALVLADIEPSCGHLEMVLAYVGRNTSHFHDAKEKVKALYSHVNSGIRWRCAYVLHLLPLNYSEDINVVRSLALDNHYTARTYGVLALKKLGNLGSEDYSVLEKVMSIDDGAAQVYAKELLVLKGSIS
jgi:hypothetical protein